MMLPLCGRGAVSIEIHVPLGDVVFRSNNCFHTSSVLWACETCIAPFSLRDAAIGLGSSSRYADSMTEHGQVGFFPPQLADWLCLEP